MQCQPVNRWWWWWRPLSSKMMGMMVMVTMTTTDETTATTTTTGTLKRSWWKIKAMRTKSESCVSSYSSNKSISRSLRSQNKLIENTQFRRGTTTTMMMMIPSVSWWAVIGLISCQLNWTVLLLTIGDYKRKNRKRSLRTTVMQSVYCLTDWQSARTDHCTFSFRLLLSICNWRQC